MHRVAILQNRLGGARLLARLEVSNPDDQNILGVKGDV